MSFVNEIENLLGFWTSTKLHSNSKQNHNNTQNWASKCDRILFSLLRFAFTFAEKTLCAMSDRRPAIHVWYLGSIRRAAIPGKMGDISRLFLISLCISLNLFLELLKEGEK